MKILQKVVVGIIEHQGKILLGRKVSAEGHPLSGAWHLPGGKIELDESEIDAVRREILAETGIEVDIDRYLGEKIVDDLGIHTRWFLCKPVTLQLDPGEDLDEVKFIPKEEVRRVCDKRAVSLWPKEVLDWFKAS